MKKVLKPQGLIDFLRNLEKINQSYCPCLVKKSYGQAYGWGFSVLQT